MSKHRAGGKFTASHTSIIPAATKLVDAVKKFPEVKRISLSQIRTGLKTGQIRIKVSPISGGLKLTVRGPTSVQEIFVYSSSPRLTQDRIRKLGYEVKVNKS